MKHAPANKLMVASQRTVRILSLEEVLQMRLTSALKKLNGYLFAPGAKQIATLLNEVYDRNTELIEENDQLNKKVKAQDDEILRLKHLLNKVFNNDADQN